MSLASLLTVLYRNMPDRGYATDVAQVKVMCL